MTLTDENEFDALLGKYALVGLTRLDANDQLIEQIQVHGNIIKIDREKSSIIIACRPDGKEFRVPSDLRGIKPAPPGEYRLRSTGEIEVNPD